MGADGVGLDQPLILRREAEAFSAAVKCGRANFPREAKINWPRREPEFSAGINAVAGSSFVPC